MEPHPILSTISAIIKFFCRLNRKEDLKSSFTGSLTFTPNTTVNLSPFFVDVIVAVPTMTKKWYSWFLKLQKACESKAEEILRDKAWRKSGIILWNKKVQCFLFSRFNIFYATTSC